MKLNARELVFLVIWKPFSSRERHNELNQSHCCVRHHRYLRMRKTRKTETKKHTKNREIRLWRSRTRWKKNVRRRKSFLGFSPLDSQMWLLVWSTDATSEADCSCIKHGCFRAAKARQTQKLHKNFWTSNFLCSLQHCVLAFSIMGCNRSLSCKAQGADKFNLIERHSQTNPTEPLPCC